MELEQYVAPHSNDAEINVIGSMMLNQSAVEDVIFTGLRATDFYVNAHSTIYETIVDMSRLNVSIDLVTVRSALLDSGKLQVAGGVEYLVNIAEATVSPSHARDYAMIVKEKSMRRKIESIGYEFVKLAHDGEKPPKELVDYIEKQVFELNGNTRSNTMQEIKSVATDFLDDIDQLYESGVPILGHKSGFMNLDFLTGGLYNTDFWVIAARPAMGKTAFVMNVATNVATQGKGAVAVFSLEMGGKQLMKRMVAGRSGISASILRRPGMTHSEHSRITEATNELYKLPIFIDDKSDLSPFELRQKARRIKQKYGLSLIVVDYLQLMTSDKRIENRTQEVAEIARALKGIAKELNVPVIALSQLSRQVENRASKRPTLSDLRESGSIEAEADLVAFLYRDAYYAQREAGKEEELEETEIIIAKHRNGSTGTVYVGFEPKIAKFTNTY